MNTKRAYLKLAHSLALAASVVLSAPLNAAPGNLPISPLFLTNSVEPNIFYTIDDSGSMEWESMVGDGTAGISSASGIPFFGGIPRYYIIPSKGNGYDGYYNPNAYPYSLPSASKYPLTWIIRNSTGNTLYYNPDVTYRPWSGADSSGNPLFGNANPVSALVDPNNPGFGTVNLTQQFNFLGYTTTWSNDSIFPAVYYTWEDSDGDGAIEDSDAHSLIEIKPANAPFPSGRDYADEIQNFANWFQYYRKRSFVAKAALGHVINNTDATRMGLDIYNAGHQQDAATMTDPALKSALLNRLYDLGIYCGPGEGFVYPNTCHGTPARNSLDRVGKLFEGLTANPSPIQPAADGGECQQNFGIIMSDGYWNGSTPSGIGNADKDSSGIANNGFDGDKNESIDNGNYEDDFSVTLADVAMHYYERDLNTSLANKVPTIAGIDEADHQHMVTYTIGFGLKGTLDPDTQSPLDTGFAWPNPMDAQDDERVDDLWHAAYNGRGKYLSAQDPTQLQRALDIAIQDIAERTATAAAVAVNSARLTEESVVYLAQFNSNRWQGNLYAYPIIDLDLGTLSETPKWEANAQLTSRDISTDPRTIITYNGSQGVPFKWNTSSLSSAMLNDLRTNPSGGTDSDLIAAARLDYLRGDRSNEGSGYQFRPRQTLLGDLVNSGPVFVGAPLLNWPDAAPFPTGGNGYSSFKNGPAKTRDKIVYVGSNDGMLHGFNDDTGKEVIAYVPNLLSSTSTNDGFHYLTNQSYIHNWYVDLSPTLSDVSITTNAGSGWRTVLIGGLRGGGRGLFALDVTDPTTFKESAADEIAMWEFSNANDSDLGYTYSRPAIALANNGRWVAILGNGYNDTGSGEAKLFILDIEAGINGWSASDYIEITTKAGTSANRNGLASPALADIDGNGTVDRVYAGDLQGNMWAFDLSGSVTSKWGVAYKQGPTPKALFTTPANQPITAKPVLAKHPTMPSDNTNAPNLMVYFGSGQYLVDSDKSNTDVQSFYGVWDRGDRELTQTDLIQQTFRSGYSERVITGNYVDYSTDHGWWFNLPDSGERSVTSPIARTDTVFFNSFVPVTDACSVGGYGYRYAVDMVNGGSPQEPVIDVNNDGEINSDDNDGDGVIAAVRQEGYLPEPVFIEDLVFTGEVADKIKKQPPVYTGRFSWQELIK